MAGPCRLLTSVLLRNSKGFGNPYSWRNMSDWPCDCVVCDEDDDCVGGSLLTDDGGLGSCMLNC
jgi:hypothetical protein